jgi:Cyclophilin type peptidyl-prolyl cis-trans isomerase/CLD
MLSRAGDIASRRTRVRRGNVRFSTAACVCFCSQLQLRSLINRCKMFHTRKHHAAREVLADDLVFKQVITEQTSKANHSTQHTRGQRKDNPVVFMDIAIAGAAAGRFTIELRADIVPRAAEHFRLMITGERGSTADHVPLCYKGSSFHRVVKDSAIYAGDVKFGDGTGHVCAYGAPSFLDENFMLRHVGPGG